LPGHHQPGRAIGPDPRCGLSGQWRVRDGRSRGGERMAGPGPGHRRIPDSDQAGGREHHPDLLGHRGGRQARAMTTDLGNEGGAGTMTADMDRLPSVELYERARAVIPGGVNSPVRAFGAVGGTPVFMTSGAGPYLTDTAGTRYVDMVCSWGPMILGHAHPSVVGALRQAITRGTSFGTVTPREVELAEEIIGRAPVEKVRLVSSGTEATMSALRLARGYTGRRLVIKFAGCYHGHVDA